MAIRPLEKQHTGEQDLELFQNNIKDFVKTLEDNPLLDGNYIEDITIVSGVTTTVNHKLDRQPRGWIICDIIGDLAQISRTAWDDKSISFNCLAVSPRDVVVKLWVF